jgi:hypothetical protein
METSILRLFNAVQVMNKESKGINQDVLKRTISNGYILDPSIVPSNEILNTIEKIVGISGAKANASFHKSWSVVKDSNIEDLISQQIIHYITTYGFEALGIYREDAVYIPNEVLELPRTTDKIKLTVIKAMTKQEILNNIVVLGTSVALSKETLKDIMVVIENNKYDKFFVSSITNRELKSRLYEFYDIIPEESNEFLRYVIKKLTGESLIIKNGYLIEKIKTSDAKILDNLILRAPTDLASIFLRFKPLFLAMKSISKNKTFFNKLRKDANRMHKALPKDYMNDVTSQIKHESISLEKLEKQLEKASIFRKIRLAYALNFRLNNKNSIIYKIRNGRGWTTGFEWNSDLNLITKEALEMILNSIVKDIQKNVKEKIVYIPSNISYALPASEKQFIGNIPSNSYVSVEEDMIVGIHWENTENSGVDLDLSLIDVTGKYGWDASYRSDERNIMFSGDVTDAPKPNGASELFYLEKSQKNPKTMLVNFYNFGDGYDDENSVEAKIVVAHEKPNNFQRNYMIDINNIVASSLVNINKRQTMLGLVVSIDGQNRFYFSSTGIGNSISSDDDGLAEKALNYLLASCVNTIELDSILSMAGANVVREKPESDEYLDLSPEALDKTTIIKLLKN